MRFSRTNLSSAAVYQSRQANRFDRQDGEPYRDNPDQRQPQESSAQRIHSTGGLGTAGAVSAKSGPAAQPFPASDDPLQSHFYLAPNVRFTRTPESEFMKRRSSSDQEGGDGQEDSRSRPEVGASAGTTFGVMPSRPAQLMQIVASQFSCGSPAVRPVEIASSVTEAPNGEIIPGNAGERDDDGGRTETIWSHLSDHAFFEFMPFEAMERDLSGPSGAGNGRTSTFMPERVPVQPVQPKRFVSRSTADVTSLYRVIECFPAQAPYSAKPERPQESAYQAQTLPDAPAGRAEPEAIERPQQASTANTPALPVAPAPTRGREVATVRPAPSPAARPLSTGGYEFPSEDLLQEPPQGQGFYMAQEQLEQNAGLLESVLEDFGVRGEIINVRPGPVVTLYEFEPAPGVKSSRVINLADDIARSMSAVSARVAVVPGRNVIGIELPNTTRETVYLRELIETADFRKPGWKLALCLGKTIGGEPVIAELAKMPHLLVAGTTGSGKSVAINTMILSLLYRLKPEECRLIMVDPKMLELSIYDGIPHLLTPVVTDPKKAVTALKWAVREMEDRYRKMARLGVRNIDGYNQRAAAAREKGEPILISIQTGFDKGTGEPIFEEQEMDLEPMPYIVVIVDEMADLMMVAGKEIEGAIQRLAQMARAAGIHLIMATQRPSVDVITGTIKANFPTRISFQVTSKIDSRTILGEQGAEQLLGQGDMLHMAGGGRISRVHGPFVSDEEVEQVVAHLKEQGRPEYLETVTADEEEEPASEDDTAVFDRGAIASEDGDDLYEQAIKIILRDKRCSTSYIQRRLGIGYNRAASLIERMEKEGLVGPANHVGKREILLGNRDHAAPMHDDMD